MVRPLVLHLVAALFTTSLALSSGTEPDRPETSAARVGFGTVVVVGDGEVFVGEPANNFRPGTVYVYRKTGGSWQEAAQLRGPAAEVHDGFGSSLSLDGSRLFVGAGATAVHVFTKQGTTWRLEGSVTAGAIPTGDAQFGNALAASGDWLLVGKAGAGGGRGRGGGGGGGGGGRGSNVAPELPPGAVYAFRRAGNTFAYHSTLTSPDAGSAGDAFGSSVALAGNVALIGAAGQAARAGVVHEFSVDAAGTWTRERSFAPLGLANGDAFGSGIVLLGERAMVTAPGDDGGFGALYMMRKVTVAGRGAGQPQGNVQWQDLLRISPPAGTRADGFAVSLAADDREVWVGAPGLAGFGGAYVFPVASDGYEPGAVRFLSPEGIAAGIGRSISIRGDVAAVGATTSSATRPEGVIIFERDASGEWRDQPLIVAALDEIPAVTGGVRCGVEGKANVFDCSNVQLDAFLPPSRLTNDGHYIQLSGIWGWTDPVTGKEWALVGRRDGATFVDISDATNPVSVADLPLTEGARPSSWREIKVYKDHAYIVSDGAGPHGMQVFDLTRLRNITPVDGMPALVTPDLLYTEINSSHNIVINEESGFAYSAGSSGGGQTCAGGLHMIDIREPKNPKFAGCFAHAGTGRSGGGYTHDAQCVTYRGPDTRYTGREICIGANETAISIADVTDKQNPRAISQASYPRVAYTHQGWFTEDQRYWFLDDEIDEGQGVPFTRTLVWDLADLENPRLAKEHMGVESSTDHNLYIKGNLMYQANYRSGLRILDISDPENPREVGFMDTAPYMTSIPGYNGAWSVYPFYNSGAIVLSGIEQGLFIMKYTPPLP